MKKNGEKAIIFLEGGVGGWGDPFAENSTKIIDLIFEPFPYPIYLINFKLSHEMLGPGYFGSVHILHQRGRRQTRRMLNH